MVKRVVDQFIDRKANVLAVVVLDDNTVSIGINDGRTGVSFDLDDTLVQDITETLALCATNRGIVE